MAVVWFDLDGTLVRFAHPYGELIAETLDRHDLPRTDDRVAAYDEAFYRAFGSCEPDPVRAGMAAVAEDGASADPGAMVSTLRETEYGAAEAAPGADAALAALADDGHAIGVLTNGLPDWQAGKLAAVGLRERVDAVVASYEAGAHKPDPAPYDLARARLPAGTHWMVGDDAEADVAGARAAGFRAIHLDPDGTGDASEPTRAVSLADVPAVIEP